MGTLENLGQGESKNEKRKRRSLIYLTVLGIVFGRGIEILQGRDFYLSFTGAITSQEILIYIFFGLIGVLYVFDELFIFQLDFSFSSNIWKWAKFRSSWKESSKKQKISSFVWIICFLFDVGCLIISFFPSKSEPINRSTFTMNMTREEALSSTVNNLVRIVPSEGFIAGKVNLKSLVPFENDVKVNRWVKGLKYFYLSRFEVTQAEYHAIMGTNPSYRNNCDDCPVENITLDDMQAYINRLNFWSDSLKLGFKFRLPKEYEWEYAAKGGNTKAYKPFSGSNDINEVAFYLRNSENTTRPVGSKMGNELDLYDMCGNVWEATSDYILLNKHYLDSLDRDINFKISEDKFERYVNQPLEKKRVFRGGAFDQDTMWVTVFSRGILEFDNKVYKSHQFGFRLAAEKK